MGGIYRNAAGEERYVHDDQRADAAKAGWAPRDEESFTNANGDVTTMTAEQVGSAFDQRIAPNLQTASDGTLKSLNAERNRADVYGGLSGGAAALGLGAASGATFGLSDLWLDATGLVDDSQLAKFQQENQGLSLLGNIGGSIVTGGVTGLTKGAASVGAKLAPGSKAAASLIAGGVEGAAFGAGQATSALVLKNEPLTAETVFAEYGQGIFLGAGFGAAGGLAGYGMGKLGGKLIGKSEGKLSRLADDVDPENALAANSDAATAVPLNSSKGKVLTEDFVAGLKGATTIADDMAEKAVTGVATEIPPQTFVRSFRLTRQWLDDNLETAVARARAGELSPEATKLVQQTQRKARRLYSDLDGPMDALGRPKVAQRGGTAATEALGDVEQRALAKKLVEYRKLARDFEEAGLGPGMGIGEAADEALALERFALNESTAKFAPEAAEFAKGYKAAKAELFDSLMVRDGVPKKRQLEVFAEMGPDDALKVAKAYSAMTKNADQLSKVMGSDFGVQAAQLADELAKVKAAIGAIARPAGGAAPEATGSAMDAMLAFGVIDAAVPDIDGPADEILSLWLASKVGKAGVVGSAKKGSSWVASFLKSGARGGTYRAASAAAGGGIQGGIAGAVGSNASGKIIDSILGNTANLAKTTSKTVARMEGVVGKMLQSAGKVTRRAAPFAPKAFLDTVQFADLDHDKSTPAFERRAAEIRANVANSYGVQKTVMANLGDVAMTHPGVADKTIAHADRVMKFLGAKLPRDPGTVMRMGRSGWKASEQDIAKFARYTRAALDPDGELERFADMDLSPEGAEALRVLYPAKFAKFQEYIAANLTTLADKLSFPEQVQMSVLFNVPVTSLMEPKTIKVLQATHAADASATPVSQPPPGAAPTPLSPAQQLLAR